MVERRYNDNPARTAIGMEAFTRINTNYDEDQPLPKPRRHNWRALANCADVGAERTTEVFFQYRIVDDNKHYVDVNFDEAKQLCNSCPVRPQCLREAIHEEGGDPYGFRAGHTEDERLEIYRTLKREGLVTSKKRTPVHTRMRRNHKNE